jgi:hypothetical protein
MVTKDVIAKLPQEQRETLAQVELVKLQRRQRLLEQAHGRDWRSRYFALCFLGVGLVFLIAIFRFIGFNFQKNLAICYLLIGIVFAISAILQSLNTNRRVDALLELLDLDRKEREDEGNQIDPKVG